MKFTPIKTAEKFKVSGFAIALVLFGGLIWFLYSYTPETASASLATVLFLLPVWLPILLWVFFWKYWLEYIRSKFIKNQEYALLEIRIPREILRSPQAMETLLTNFHIGSGETTFINRYIEGKVRPWYSLEMVSIEGKIHFYIWTRKFLKNVVEAQIYGQYPMVEVHEVEDYAQKVIFDPAVMGVWGCDFDLSEPDAYPIKTYVDYGLDKDPKEEFKIDPMGGFFEFLSKIGPGEQLWFQILIRVNRDKLKEDRKTVKAFGMKDEDKKYSRGNILFGRTTSWKEQAKKEIEKIRADATPARPGSEFPGFPNPTPGQTDTIKAIERSISKLGFDVGMRGIYIAEKDRFNAVNITALTASLKQLNSNGLNGFYPTGWLTRYDFPWQDYKDRKKNRDRANIIEAYKRRSWFHVPYKSDSFVLNTEELATIFHFPGAVVQAPSIERISSTKGEAPPNLPS